MIKALVLKELRESAGIVAVAALALLYCFLQLTKANVALPVWSQLSLHLQEGIPFVSDQILDCLAIVCGGLAIALGLKQSAWELNRGTYHFLLHRPIARNTIFATKLTVGVLLMVALPTVMLLAYAWWAATPGNSAAPFYWSMTVPAWRCVLAMTILYLTAFLSGLRPARWFGTRLLPLVAGVVATMLVTAVPLYAISLAVAVVTIAISMTGIFQFVAHRDF